VTLEIGQKIQNFYGLGLKTYPERLYGTTTTRIQEIENLTQGTLDSFLFLHHKASLGKATVGMEIEISNFIVWP
jgi:hypothetical protein